jgi:hypothetical protein
VWGSYLLDRVAVPGCHSRLGHRVLCEREGERIVEVLSHYLYRAEGVHKAHGDSAPKRRVRAGPRIANTDDPRRHRNAIHNETPVTIEYTTHGEHVSDRLAIKPMCVPRTCGYERRPVLGIAEFLSARSFEEMNTVTDQVPASLGRVSSENEWK